MRANDLSRFSFEFCTWGHYLVTYRTDRGDFYKALVTDMPLIDATKNAEWARLCDIKELRSMIIRNGTHFHKNGTRFED